MPYNVWCQGCGDLIGKGVRFNAEKKQTGQYHSTKVWSFTMKHHCGCKIVVRTDPKSCEYLLEAGAHRKVCISPGRLSLILSHEGNVHATAMACSAAVQ